MRERIISQEEEAQESGENPLRRAPVICKVQGCEAEASTGCHGYCNEHYVRVLYSSSVYGEIANIP